MKRALSSISSNTTQVWLPDCESHVFVDPSKEKILRSAFKSEVEKGLDAETIVIADSLNYIKGYRYELYCLARGMTTTLCNVFCNTDKEVAQKLASESNIFPTEL